MQGDVSEAPITLHLTGPFAVTDATGAEVEGLSRRGQAMLAYLSRQPGLRAERGLLADLLWSDRGEDQARASLRQELSVLRRHLPGGSVLADRQMVRLDPEGFCFHATPPGCFLEGFDLASEGFEDWLRLMRAACPETPLQFLTTGMRFISWEVASEELMEFAFRLLVNNGIRRFAIMDPMNHVPALDRPL